MRAPEPHPGAPPSPSPSKFARELWGGWMKRGLGIPWKRGAGSASTRTLDGMTWGITGAHRPAGHTWRSPPGSWIWRGRGDGVEGVRELRNKLPAWLPFHPKAASLPRRNGQGTGPSTKEGGDREDSCWGGGQCLSSGAPHQNDRQSGARARSRRL